jgi:hypothetical protein
MPNSVKAALRSRLQMVDSKEEVRAHIFVLPVFYFFLQMEIEDRCLFLLLPHAQTHYIAAFHYVSLQFTMALVKGEMEKTLHWLAPIATNTTK